MVYRLSLVLISLIISISCIHENRDECPSYLTLDLGDVPEGIENIFMVLEYEDGTTVLDTIPLASMGSVYEKAVPRGPVQMAIYGNIRNMRYDNGFTVPVGLPADNIYTYFQRKDIDSDLTIENINISKNNIGINVKIKGYSQPDSSVLVFLEGSAVGFTNNGAVAKGRFYHHMYPATHLKGESNTYLYNSRIPRMDKNDTFHLNLITSDNGDTIASISIGDKMESSGMDLSAAELNDLFLTIDISRSTLKISVGNFDAIPHHEIKF